MADNIDMIFQGCKHLDYEGEYRSCNRQAVRSGDNKALFWMRPVDNEYPDKPRMVQFCKKRGRLNDPHSCLNKYSARCGDYENMTHTVCLPRAELES